jgi:hypothetical protein
MCIQCQCQLAIPLYCFAIDVPNVLLPMRQTHWTNKPGLPQDHAQLFKRVYTGYV